ncbi:type IV secretory system conjugative DNA transfer family protein [Amaricoccus sp. W119]|uniref:type IV secretory system conjugative DNA transfer family protein n=1 Tax=Amaricoccus sp. W119 TaxID=3391833 RepID=UPI0039A4D873
MIARALTGLARAGLRLLVQLWPLWLFWGALRLSLWLWRDGVLLSAGMDRSSAEYAFAYAVWPSAGLIGPILVMLIALALHRAGTATRTTALASLSGVAFALVLTLKPAWDDLAARAGTAPPLELLGGVPMPYLAALVTGLVGLGIGIRLLSGEPLGGEGGPGGAHGPLRRARSDNHGHADWLSMKDARRLFPGPDPRHGGIVVGEAYRVDLDRHGSSWHGSSRRPFDPADPATWGAGGTAPLLIDPCRSGSTHALVLAGSGGFKTTSVGIPTMLAWTGSAVVLDPAREIGPMVGAYRAASLGHRVVTLDPAAGAGSSARTGASVDPSANDRADDPAGGFNALDWIDVAGPLAETNVEAVATWLAGEPARGAGGSGGGEFFRDMGRGLIACLLADLMWDPALPRREKTLRRLRQALVIPEAEMRTRLGEIHGASASPMARDLAGTLMGLVDETFSGVYANANQATRWLSIRAYADLVSGESFETRELCEGRLTVFVQLPLKTLQATPGLGRVIVGALLNAAYEADGATEGRVLFLLDEVARLGPMAALEAARDAGRKYGMTLLLLYQSAGQLTEQWGREGARAWIDSTAWRLYAAVQDPETARALSQACGEHGVMALSEGDTRGTSGRWGGTSSASSGKSANRSEIRRALIKPDELIQDTRADEAFVIARGHKPLRCGRAIYFRRPEMRALVAPSRFEAASGPRAAE